MWEVSTDRPVSLPPTGAGLSRLMKDHDFGFCRDGQSVVLTPRLCGVHHLQKLYDRGGNEAKIIHIQKDR